MSAFGENLRREREMRGVSLEEISSATKISLRFLDAIEREDFAKLPGGIFSRSFVRSYARYLGLDEERVGGRISARCTTSDGFRLTPDGGGQHHCRAAGVTNSPDRHRRCGGIAGGELHAVPLLATSLGSSGASPAPNGCDAQAVSRAGPAPSPGFR